MKENLLKAWIAAKQIEKDAVENRRIVEDRISEALDLDEQNEGSKTVKENGYSIKVTQRMTKKIDADALQEIATQEGLQDHLSNLFRWKPEMDKKAWDSASESITQPLSKAITMKAGRPSYTILKEED